MNDTKCDMLLGGHRHQLYLELFFETLSLKLLEIQIQIQNCKFFLLPVTIKFEATVTILQLPKHHANAYTFCNFSRIDPVVSEILKFL